MSDVQQATRSRLVDELLQLVGLDAEAPPNPGPSPAPQKSDEKAAAHRQRLVTEYEARYEFGPPGATREQLVPLIAARVSFTKAVEAFDAEPEHLSMAFDHVAAAFTSLGIDLGKARTAHAAAVRKLEAALPPSDRPHVVAGATAAEAKPFNDRYDSVAKLLAEPAAGKGMELSDLRDAITQANGLADDLADFRHEVQQREEARHRLTTELAKVVRPGVTDPDLIVKGATANDVAPLVKARDAVAKVLADPAATLTAINDQSNRIGELRIEKSGVADAVSGRAARIEEITEAATVAWQDLVNGADPSDAKAFLDKINTARERQLDDAAVKAAEIALEALRSTVDDENDLARERAVLRKGLQLRVDGLNELIRQTCAGYDVENVEETLFGIQEAINGKLYEIDFDGLDEEVKDARRALDAVVKEVVGQGKNRKAPAPTQYLIRGAEAAAAEGARLLPFAGQAMSALKKLPGQLDELKELLSADAAPEPGPEEEPSGKKGKRGRSAPAKKPASQAPAKSPSIEALSEAMDVLVAMRVAVDAAAEVAGAALEQLTAQREALLARAGVPNPDALPPGFGAALDKLREGVTDPLGEEMSMDVDRDVIKTATTAANLFERDLADAAALAAEWDETAFSTARGEARSPVQPNLDAAHAAVLTSTGNIAIAVALAKQLAALTAQVDAEAGKAAGAKRAIGKAATGPDALDEPTATFVYDLVGPDAIGAAAATPSALATLCACFKAANAAERTGLNDLVADGFRGEGKLLAGLVRSNDGAGILALARAYGGATNKDDRKRLGDLVAKGGLGDMPAVLDDLLGYGAADAPDSAVRRDNNIAQLKALGTAFGDSDGPARMRTLVVDCSLGQPRPTPPGGPGILAEALQSPDGLDGDAVALRKLADGYAGDTPADGANRDRLKGLVQGGGFGDRPRAFAPLLKRLSDGGGAAGAASKLKEIGTTFQDPTDRGKLKALLDIGGMSGDTGEATPYGHPRRHEHGDTLAKVFTDGLDSRADKLKDFAAAFGDTPAHAEECRLMMGAWNEFPDTSKDDRQPGEKVGLLLGGNHFNGDVNKLQTQFTTAMAGFGDPAKRRLATRFAPHFNKRNMPGKQPDLTGTAANTAVMGYIGGRHLPSCAKDGVRNNGADWLAAQNSYFPVDTTPGEVADMIKEAMSAPNAPGLSGSSTVTLSNGIAVEIAVSATGAVVHVVPLLGMVSPHPKELAKFTKAESERIFRAVRP